MGKISSGSYQELLDHYKSLPPIEKAQISEGYDVQLQNLIDQNGPDSSQNGDELESVFDLIMKRLNDRTEKHMALLNPHASSHAGNGGE
ncbi:hypothetical protein [Pseudomonas sp. KNUC1026]|uniref:hypothetical protein n=1 Tax=Pseudomonas sp. KNUC1026 TaxID=2893890 RepID=UPI001F3E26E3|nr:hypothetical protein [Pseudomonas sp. KNUC1026]UFH50616.1 hypothetical protein LN139_05385 [Pseudomonas sp. KNUC1026]